MVFIVREPREPLAVANPVIRKPKAAKPREPLADDTNPVITNVRKPKAAKLRLVELGFVEGSRAYLCYAAAKHLGQLCLRKVVGRLIGPGGSSAKALLEALGCDVVLSTVNALELRPGILMIEWNPEDGADPLDRVIEAINAEMATILYHMSIVPRKCHMKVADVTWDGRAYFRDLAGLPVSPLASQRSLERVTGKGTEFALVLERSFADFAAARNAAAASAAIEEVHRILANVEADV